MATSYINAAGGADYTSLTAWWTAVKDSADPTETAILQSNLTGWQNCTTAGTNNKTVVIQSDGTRRSITTTGTNAALLVGTAVATTVTLDGLELVGNATHGCLSILAPTINIKNCIVRGAAGRGIDLNQAYTTATIENTLVYDCVGIGIRLAYTSAATTTTLNHCGVYANGGGGFQIAFNANITCDVNNSWFLSNTGYDIQLSTSGTTTLRNTVTSDSSADSTSWDSKTSPATAKTSYASYFTDPANRDFTLLDDDEALWGINSNSTYSPATDIDGTTRATYDIGPYEFAGADPPVISSVTLTGTSQIGQTLTATVVTDQDPVDSTTYQWQKAATDDAEPGTDLSGTASTLALSYSDFADLLDADVDSVYVRCQAIATKNSLASDEDASDWQLVSIPSEVSAGGGSLLESSLIR